MKTSVFYVEQIYSISHKIIADVNEFKCEAVDMFALSIKQTGLKRRTNASALLFASCVLTSYGWGERGSGQCDKLCIVIPSKIIFLRRTPRMNSVYSCQMERTPSCRKFFGPWLPALFSRCINRTVTSRAKIATAECRRQKFSYVSKICYYVTEDFAFCPCRLLSQQISLSSWDMCK